MKKNMFRALFLCVCASCLLLTACGRESELEESAVPVVTDIIHQQLGGDANCVKVKITEKIDDKHYKATATLSNGNDLKVMIEDRGEQILVTIPLNQ